MDLEDAPPVARTAAACTTLVALAIVGLLAIGLLAFTMVRDRAGLARFHYPATSTTTLDDSTDS